VLFRSDGDGNGPLHLAGDRKVAGAFHSSGQLDHIELLIEKGADVNLVGFLFFFCVLFMVFER